MVLPQALERSLHVLPNFAQGGHIHAHLSVRPNLTLQFALNYLGSIVNESFLEHLLFR